MYIDRYNFILSASLLALTTSLCQASNQSSEEQNIKQKTQVRDLSREEILGLTPANRELVNLAKSGNPEAINRLGMCLLRGVDCTANVNKAFKCFQAAAKLKHPAGLLNLAGALFEGDGCVKSEQNDRLAVSCLKLAGELGRVDGKYEYANCLLNGKGCDRTLANQNLAWQLFKEMADDGHDRSMYMIARGFIDGQDRTPANQKEGVRWLKKAADLGHVDALAKLGKCYLLEIGCKRDNKAAFNYLKEAADQGSTAAMQDLSLCLLHGIGCEKTPETEALAIENYLKLAEKGYVSAMLSLALAFEQGHGVTQDLKKARHWYEKTAARSRAPSDIYMLALFYFHNKEYDLALPQLELIKTQYRVGELLGYIYFRKKDYERALLNYEDAREKGTEDVINISKNKLIEAKTVNPALINFLIRKVNEARAVGQILPKSETTNVPQQLALAAQEAEFKGLQTRAQKLLESLTNRLSAVAENPDFNAAQELENLNKTYKLATGTLETLDMAKRIDRLKKLTELMDSAEGRLLAHEQKLESDKKVVSMREQALKRGGMPAQEELETAQDRNLKKETKAAAAKALKEEKDLKHKKASRKHAPLPKGKSIAKESAQPEVKVEKPAGPFSAMKKPIRRTQANIPDAAWNKVYQIRDALRDAESMEAAIGSLRSLEGDFNLKEIEPAYAVVPNDCIAYEMRINDQYRVIIAFQPEIVREFEPSKDVQNNNNAFEKTAYKLYGNTIYVDDPHKK